MRQRIEDLGRIGVLLDQLLELELWEVYQGRRKDFVEHFSTLSKEKQEELLHNIIYGLEAAKERLWDVRAIAYGQDNLNDVFPE